MSKNYEGFLLSPQQKRVWQLREVLPDKISAIKAAIEIEGELETEILRRAIGECIRRQAILRTSFQSSPELAFPLQIVSEEILFEFDEINSDSTTEIEDFFRPKYENLTSVPRFALIHSNNGKFVLLVAFSALCADKNSIEIFARELSENYSNIKNNTEKSEPEFQYLHFSELQNQLLEDDENRIAIKYWANFETENLRSMRLPFTVSSGESFQKETFEFQIPDEKLRLINEFAERQGVPPQTVFFTAWQILLSRLSGAREITIGAAANGRKYEELTEIIGLTDKFLPIRSVIKLSEMLSALLTKNAAALTDAEEWQEGFSAVNFVENNSPTLFPFGFEWLTHAKAIKNDYLRLNVKQIEGDFEIFDLLLSCCETADNLVFKFDYDASLFTKNYIAQIAEHLAVLVAEISEKDDCRVGDFDILNDERKRRIIEQSQGKIVETENLPNVVELFERICDETPAAVAVKFGDQIVTFADLNTRANQTANFLLREGVSEEEIVGILLENSAEMMAAILGVLKAGAAYLPIDASYPAERVSYILSDAKVSFLLTDAANSAKFAFDETIQKVLLDAENSEIRGQNAENPNTEIDCRQTAYVIYTSGSTGKPKGVMISHRGLDNYLNWAKDFYEVEKGNGAPLHSSIAFDLSITSSLLPLICGKAVILAAKANDVEWLAETLQAAQDLSLVKITPAHARLLGQQFLQTEAAKKTNRIVLGGENLTLQDVAFWQENAPETVLINEYGPTETVVGCCVYEIPKDYAQKDSIPIGKPIANTQIFVLNENLRLAPNGVTGELYIGGDGLARGYLGKADLTAEKFVPHPFSENGERLYRTGDVARYAPDGNLEFLGRIDSQVKVRGYRVELGEIETVITEIPAVKEAVVTAAKDENGNQNLTAYYILSPAHAKKFKLENLRELLENKLPEYMIPAHFVALDSIPLTQNGKVDFRALADAKAASQNGSGFVYSAPRTAEEEILCGVWSRVLGVERVGIDDRYFALGGDSLRSIQVISQAQAHGVEFSIEQLFKHQTIRRIVEEIRNNQAKPPLKVEHFGLISDVDLQKIPSGIESAYPLSRLQAGMVFHRELEPESSIYHDVFGYHIKAPLQAELLREAIKQLIKRHPALRTAFDLQNYNQPLQLIYEVAKTPLEIENISHLSPEEQEKFLLAFLEAEKSNHFDYVKPPLLRFYVHVRDAESFQFWISFHHAIIDGWSDISLLVEIGLSYGYLLRGEPIPFTSPATHYRDFVALEQASLASEDHQKFWLEKLDESEFLRIPRLKLNNEPAQDAQIYGVNVKKVPVSPEVSAKLLKLSEKLAMPLKSVLMAAHLKVLQAVSGQNDVLTALVSVGRPETIDAEKVLGLHLNSTPFRLELQNETWRELINRAFEFEREALPYRRFPLAEIQNLRGGEKLSETLFYFTHYYNVLDLEAVPEIEILGWYPFEQSSFPLLAHFSVNTFNSSVEVYVIGDKKEFTQAEVERLCGYYERVLTALTEDAEKDYADNFISTEEERIIESNASQLSFDSQSIARFFEIATENFAEKSALVFKNKTLSYGELNAQSNRLANYLIEFGVKRGDFVGIYLERSIETIVGILAILKCGAAYVPLETAYPRERLALMLEETNAKIVLTRRSLRGKFTADKTVCLDEIGAEISNRSSLNPNVKIDDEDVAYAIFTSGSTGQPKGVIVPHRAVLRLVKNADYADLNERETILQLAPTSFDASVFEIFGALLNGGTLVLPESENPSTIEIGETLRREKITTLWLTAGLFRVMAEENTEDLSGLRQLLAGGDVLSVSHVGKVLRHNPELRLINGYGPTENTTFTCCHQILEAPASGESVPIGKAINGTQIYILDRSFKRVPVGAVGEIYASGAGLAHGYLNQPDLMAEKFVPNPFSEGGERLYRTGDIARFLTNGAVEFLGRRDRQVKIRGYRIEAGEIECVLLAHQLIKQAIVQALKDKNGEKFLAAYYVAENENPLNQNELREFLHSRLPEYMIPAAFISLNEIPLTANGKINYAALPTPTKFGEPKNVIKPRTDTEKTLAKIWTEVLEEPSFGIEDNFFALGGHSLKAMQIVVRIRDTFGLELSLKTVFESPTIEKLAEKIDFTKREKPASQNKSIEILPRSEHLPLSAAQQRLWFTEQLGAETSAYNVPLTAVLSGKVDTDALARGLNKLVERHEILRTSFHSNDGVPQTRIGKIGEINLEISDLTALSEDGRERAAREKSIEFIRRRFDLTEAPLWRAMLIRLTENENLLVMALHHIIGDAWSIGILMRELAGIYSAYLKNSEPDLPELPLQYADFAAWQKNWLESTAKDSAVSFWKTNLRSLTELSLPTDFPRPAKQSFRGAKHTILLPNDLAEKTENLGRKQDVTVFMTLLAVFKILLRHHAKNDDISIGTDVANRNYSQTESVVGLFVNQLVLRTKFSASRTFTEVLEKVRETTLNAFEHQELPFSKVVEAVNPGRNLRQNPLFQVMFILQNTPLPHAELGNLTVSTLEVDAETSAFDLSLHVWEREDGLQCTFRYATDLFAAETTAAFAENFRSLLEKIVADENVELTDLDEFLLLRHKLNTENKATAARVAGLQKLKSLRSETAN